MFVACIVLAGTLLYAAYYVTSPHDLLPCTIMVASTYGIGFGIGPAITSEFGIEVRDWERGVIYKVIRRTIMDH
jgi:hypothetical protein